MHMDTKGSAHTEVCCGMKSLLVKRGSGKKCLFSDREVHEWTWSIQEQKLTLNPNNCKNQQKKNWKSQKKISMLQMIQRQINVTF